MSKPYHRDEPAPISRREALGRGVAAAALVALPSTSWPGPWRGAGTAERPWLDDAERAERWIARSAVRDARGTTWPADPNDAASVQDNLYSGSPGVVLFYLELHAATGKAAYLQQARAGADYLAATLPAEPAALREGGTAGLYTGVAGVAYTLAMVARATGNPRPAAAAQRAFALLRSAAVERGAGVAWNDSSDIISGSAGIALALLWASRALGDAAARDLAVRAGRHLVELGEREQGGLKWAISGAVPRRYPNFSHGTAGAAYTLATLHGETRERPFLDAALAGHAYLAAIATTTPNDGLRVFHSEPGGEELFYLSWCHGPAGTARLYHRLAEVTGEAKWRAYVPRLARAIVASGVPEVRPDRSGYWNNVSRCCGNGGVTDFFVDLHRQTGERGHLDYAERVARDTLSRATAEGDGLKWVQAEHRVRPELLVAQTGLMQGAAGVGLSFLQLDGALVGRRPRVVLPDSPW